MHHHLDCEILLKFKLPKWATSFFTHPGSMHSKKLKIFHFRTMQIVLIYIHFRTIWHSGLISIFQEHHPASVLHYTLRTSTMPLLYLYIIFGATVTYMYGTWIVYKALHMRVNISFPSQCYPISSCSSIFELKIDYCTWQLVSFPRLLLMFFNFKVKSVLNILAALLQFQNLQCNSFFFHNQNVD